MSSSIPIILLAAGESQRMGRQKQLLPIQGKPMVRCAAELACQLSAGPVIVVVGAGADTIVPVLAGLEVRCAVNPTWQEGMGTSLRQGMQLAGWIAPDAPAVMVLLADQPGISAGHLAALIERHQQFPGDIVASEYRGVSQPPALFPWTWFARLAGLTGDRGARAILREAADRVQLVPLDSLGDIDTPEDYEAFIKNTLGPGNT